MGPNSISGSKKSLPSKIRSEPLLYNRKRSIKRCWTPGWSRRSSGASTRNCSRRNPCATLTYVRPSIARALVRRPPPKWNASTFTSTIRFPLIATQKSLSSSRTPATMRKKCRAIVGRLRNPAGARFDVSLMNQMIRFSSFRSTNSGEGWSSPLWVRAQRKARKRGLMKYWDRSKPG